MKPQTQSQGSLQPPGRLPPTAIATATPPPPAPEPAEHRTRRSRVGRWVVNLAPMPVMLMSSVAAVASSTERARITGFLISVVSFFLIGLFMGLGRYRGSESYETIRSPR